MSWRHSAASERSDTKVHSTCSTTRIDPASAVPPPPPLPAAPRALDLEAAPAVVAVRICGEEEEAVCGVLVRGRG